MTALFVRSGQSARDRVSLEKRRSAQRNPDLGNACCIAIKFAGFTGPRRLPATAAPPRWRAIVAAQTTTTRIHDHG